MKSEMIKRATRILLGEVRRIGKSEHSYELHIAYDTGLDISVRDIEKIIRKKAGDTGSGSGQNDVYFDFRRDKRAAFNAAKKLSKLDIVGEYGDVEVNEHRDYDDSWWVYSFKNGRLHDKEFIE